MNDNPTGASTWLTARTSVSPMRVRHIQRCAARQDGRIVAVGQLILFSTQMGLSWLLDRGWTCRAAGTGRGSRTHIEGHYRIEGVPFVFADRNTRRTRAILEYPTQKPKHAARGG
jgi:hypothetical protein